MDNIEIIDIKQPCINCISKADLYVIAKNRNISRRTKMNKKQLYMIIYNDIYYCDKHILQLEGEIWRELHESININNKQNYRISNFGRLKNVKKNRILQGKVENGYLRYTLTIIIDGKTKNVMFQANRLVGLTFIKNPNNLPHVDHIDRNKLNNHISNLRWLSIKDNNNNRKVYKNYGCRKRVNQYDLKGNFIKEWESITSANNYYKIKSSSSISQTCRGKYKTCKGFIWKYIEYEQIEGEIWKLIPLKTKYSYYISNKGRIKNSLTGRISKGKLSGYPPYNFSKDNLDNRYRRTDIMMSNNKKKNYGIHILIMLAFVGPMPKNKEIVNHIDENKENNCLENLKYATQQENVMHSIYKQSKIILQYDLNGNFIKEYPSIREASRQTKINRSSISKNCDNIFSKAGNYIWLFKSDFNSRNLNNKIENIALDGHCKPVLQYNLNGEFIKE